PPLSSVIIPSAAPPLASPPKTLASPPAPPGLAPAADLHRAPPSRDGGRRGGELQCVVADSKARRRRPTPWCDGGRFQGATAKGSKARRLLTSRCDGRSLLQGVVDSVVRLKPSSKHHPIGGKGTRKFQQIGTDSPSFKIKC
ncbi:hypothetical protein EJB05_37545, partial [Eragrostis curvula]